MGGAPHAQFVSVAPNAKMDSGAFDGGREPRKGNGGERERPLERQRLPCLLGRKEGKRNLGKVAFLAPEACPEGGVDDRLDCQSVWLWGYVLLSLLARSRYMAGEAVPHPRRHPPHAPACLSV